MSTALTMLFSSTRAGATDCPNAIPIPSIPVFNQAVVCGTTNDITATNVAVTCGSTLYYGGLEALYTFTPTVSGAVEISIDGGTTTNYLGLFVFDGCPTTTGTNCMGSFTTGTTYTGTLTVTLTAGTTYYLMFDTWPSPASPCPATFSIATCAAPTIPAFVSATTTDATVNWTGTAANYEVEYGTSSTLGDPTNLRAIASVPPPYTITGLTASTGYYWWVRSVCGPGDTSAWTTVSTFTTACTTIPAPYGENFNSGALPSCWTNSNSIGGTSTTLFWQFNSANGTPNYGAQGNGGRTLGNFAWVDASSPQTATVVLTSPILDLSSLSTPTVKFDWFHNNTDVTNTPNSNLLVEAYDGTAWTTVMDDTSNSTSWRTVTFALPASFIGVTNAQFRFSVDKTLSASGSNPYYNDILLDSFLVDNAPSCLGPSTVATTNITAASVDINWTAPAIPPANGYEYEVRTSGNAGSGATGLITTGTVAAGVTTVSISGLTSNTAYTVYVRGVCSATDQSSWSAGANFTTLISCYGPTAVTTANITTTSGDLNWTASTSAPANGYEYEVRTSGAAGSGATGLFTSGTVAAGTTTVSLTGLNPATTYTVYLRSDCGGGDFSAWTSGVTLTTTCVGTVPPWTENFDALSTIGTGILPSCWTLESGGWGVQAGTGTRYSPYSGSNFLRIPWSQTNAWTWTPGFTLTAGTSYDFSFYWRGDNYSPGTWDGAVSVNGSPSSVGATQLGTNFITSGTVAPSTYQLVTYTFVPTTTGDYFFGLQVNEPTGAPWYLSFDDFAVDVTPTCVAPTLPSTSNITAATVDLSWTASTSAPALGYEYEIRTSGVGGSGATGLATSGSTAAGVTTATATGLAPATTYTYYVRAVCSGTDFSSWAMSGTFTTACATLTAPYAENFNTGVIPNCWTNSNSISSTTASLLWKFTNTGGTPNYGAQNNGRAVGNYAWVDASSPYNAVVTLTTPIIDLSGLSTPTVKFDWYKNHSTSTTAITPPTTPPNNLLVEGYDGSTWVQLFNDTSSSTSWRTVTLALPANFSGVANAQFRFSVDKNLSNNFYDDVLLDSFSVDNGLPVTCFAPTAVTASGITAISANVNWTAPASAPANGYEYEVRTSGAAGSGATGLVTSGTTAAGVTTVSLSGLNAGTAYTVYVRSVCGATDLSAWSTGAAFTTIISCTAPTGVNATSITATSATLNWTASASAPANGYEYEVRTSGAAGSGATGLVTSGTTAAGVTTASVTGLSATTTYTVYVRSACSATDFSSWTAAVTFTTTSSCIKPVVTVNGVSHGTFSTCAGNPLTLTATGASNYVWAPVTGLSCNTCANPIATPTVGTTYYVVGSNGVGCSDTDTVVVVVNPSPAVNAGPDVSSCGGSSSTQLNATGTGISSYSWSPSTGLSCTTCANPIASPTTTTTYRVVASNTFGCTDTDFVTVSVSGTAPVVHLGNDTTVCVGSTLTLDANNPGLIYSWNTGAVTQTIPVTTAGTYSVTVNNGSGCVGRDTINVSAANPPVVNLGNNATICAGSTIALNAGPGTSYSWNTGANTQSLVVATAGTYSVVVNNAAGCTGTDAITIAVSQLPVVNLGNDTMLCAGGSFALDAGNAGSTYSWNTGATTQTLAVNSPNSYSVTVTNADGCVGTDAITIMPGMIPVAGNINVSGGSPTFTFAAVGSTPGMHGWDFGDGGVDTALLPTHTYTANGTYTVRYFVMNPCGIDTATAVVTVANAAVNTVTLNGEVTLAPNPASDRVLIRNTNAQAMKHITVLNAVGAVVRDTTPQNGKEQSIDLSGLAAATYMVRIEFDGGAIVVRKLQITQ